MSRLVQLARACAVLAGVLLTGITLMTCISLIGRNTIGATILGDYELTAVAAGAAVALFMPLSQLRREHIIVDFFTARVPARINARLDRLGSLLFAVMMGVLVWRTSIGAIDAYQSQSTTMLAGFPEWIAYGVMVPPFALAAVIAAIQVVCPNVGEEASA